MLSLQEVGNMSKPESQNLFVFSLHPSACSGSSQESQEMGASLQLVICLLGNHCAFRRQQLFFLIKTCFSDHWVELPIPDSCSITL